MAVTRELTKRHEQQVGPTLTAALAHFRSHAPQGEFTLVIGGATTGKGTGSSDAAPSQDSLRAALEALIAGGLSRSDAARQLAQQSGIPRRELYALVHTAEEPS